MFHNDLSSFLKFYLVWLVYSSATMFLAKLTILYVTQIRGKKNNQPPKKIETCLASIIVRFQGGYLIPFWITSGCC
jgi:hypothetical protein